MLYATQATDEPIISAPVVMIVMIVCGIVYGLGYAMAVMRRANRDYKTTKAAVPGLRKGFWAAWRGMIKFAIAVGVVAFILIAWVVRDFRDLNATPTPSPSASKTR